MLRNYSVIVPSEALKYIFSIFPALSYKVMRLQSSYTDVDRKGVLLFPLYWYSSFLISSYINRYNYVKL